LAGSLVSANAVTHASTPSASRQLFLSYNDDEVKKAEAELNEFEFDNYKDDDRTSEKESREVLEAELDELTRAIAKYAEVSFEQDLAQIKEEKEEIYHDSDDDYTAELTEAKVKVMTVEAAYNALGLENCNDNDRAGEKESREVLKAKVTIAKAELDGLTRAVAKYVEVCFEQDLAQIKAYEEETYHNPDDYFKNELTEAEVKVAKAEAEFNARASDTEKAKVTIAKAELVELTRDMTQYAKLCRNERAADVAATRGEAITDAMKAYVTADGLSECREVLKAKVTIAKAELDGLTRAIAKDAEVSFEYDVAQIKAYEEETYHNPDDYFKNELKFAKAEAEFNANDCTTDESTALLSPLTNASGEMLMTAEKRAMLRGYCPSSLRSPSQLDARNWTNESSTSVGEAFSRTFPEGAFLFNNSKRKWIHGEHVDKITTKLRIRMEANRKAMHAAIDEHDCLKTIFRAAQLGVKAIEKGRPTSETIAIKHLYQYLRHACNKYVDSNGASTYAELNESSTEDIIRLVIELGCLPPNGVAVDLGCGFMLPLAHMAQRLAGRYIGIEYDEGRAWGFAFWYRKLLEKEQLINSKIGFLWSDIYELKSLDFADVIYVYDEAFPPPLIRFIFGLFGTSKRPQWLISFKTGKKFSGRKHLEQELKSLAGVEEIRRVQLAKYGSGESSSAIFFKRINQVPVSPTDTDESVLRRARPFWSDDKEAVLAAVTQLEETTYASLPLKTRKQGKWRAA
jgi:hypothetical protein